MNGTAELVDPAASPSDALADLDHRPTAHLVAQAVRDLSPQYREMIVEVCFRGRTMVEIATRHDLPLGVVKSRIHNALRVLCLSLQECGVAGAA